MKFAKDFHFRQSARESLRGNWKIAVGAGFVAMLLGGASYIGPELQINIQTDIAYVSFHLSEATTTPLMVFAFHLTPFLIGISILLALIAVVIGYIIGIGYTQFNLDVADRKETLDINTLFNYFADWKRILWTCFLRNLFTCLWGALFIIPGIFAHYSYAMTDYILAEQPELSATEAIGRSKAMMNGNRWRLFCLRFSFIGWKLLCVATLGIASLWIAPYLHAAEAHFYREVSASYAE